MGSATALANVVGKELGCQHPRIWLPLLLLTPFESLVGAAGTNSQSLGHGTVAPVAIVNQVAALLRDPGDCDTAGAPPQVTQAATPVTTGHQAETQVAHR